MAVSWRKRIEQFKEAHGDKYTYTKPEKVSSLTKILIECPIHGQFQQTIKKHIIGQGCKACGLISRSKTRSLGQQEFIRRSKEAHQNFYTYENTHYKNSLTDIVVTCPVHGDFTVNPRTHMDGHKCPKCAVEAITLSQEKVIEQFIVVHKNRYDYSKVVYSGYDGLVDIICKKHGLFSQRARTHASGSHCPYCAGTKRHWEDFKKECNKVHKDKYTYPDQPFDGIPATKLSLSIICPEHGVFKQIAEYHYNGYGCPECGGTKKLSREEVINRFKEAHGDRYDYALVVYKNRNSKISIICPEHGVFKQSSNHHLNGSGCPSCSHRRSNKELELRAFIESLGVSGLQFSTRKLIPPYEIDIAIPEKKIALEFNGLYWHSSDQKPNDYHEMKTKLCKEKGYRLIHIWEDDWDFKKDIVKSFLKHNIIGPSQRIFARKTSVKAIDKLLAKEFLCSNHIQGHSQTSVAIGLFYEGQLVTVTTFLKNGYWELRRHCNLKDTAVIGALGKTTKYFVRNYCSGDLFSFCDLSMHDGRSYEAAGFVEHSKNSRDYKYVIGYKRLHKFGFRRKKLATFLGDGFKPELSEVKNMHNNGYYRIFDCGKIKYRYNRREL